MKTTDMTEPLETKSERHYFRMSGWMGERWTELLEREKKTHDGERKSPDLSHRSHVETLRWKTTGRADVLYQCGVSMISDATNDQCVVL